jgi:hypothetical protein
MIATNTAVLLALSIPVWAQPPAPVQGRSTEELLIQNEKSVWEASKAKNVDDFNRLVAPDARMVFESGVLTRTDYLKGLPDRSIKDFELTDFAVLLPNAQTAIVIYKATRTGTYMGKPFPPATVREATVWVKRKGKWVAVLNQETATRD